MTWDNIWTTWLTSSSEEWPTGLYYFVDNFLSFNKNITNPFLSKTFKATPYWFIEITLFFTLIVLLKQFVNGESNKQPNISYCLNHLRPTSFLWGAYKDGSQHENEAVWNIGLNKRCALELGLAYKYAYYSKYTICYIWNRTCSFVN